MLNFPVVREVALFKSSAIFTEEKETTKSIDQRKRDLATH